jgi:aminopeptidase N
MPKLAAALVKFYSGMLGAIPAEELDIVEIPAYGFGISPSGMVLITSEAYTNVAAKFASGINARLAHEIAHQWFGHKAIPAENADNWMQESFAEYFAGIAMGALAAKEKAMHGFDQMLIEWRSEAKYCVTGGTIATANYLGGEHGPRDRYCLLYNRGPLVLHMLRTSVGNDRFFAATKRYLDIANNGPASTDDYAKAISDAVQLDMRWYFDQWVRRSGNAQVDVEQHVDPAAGGQYRLWGTITQAPGDGFKKLLVPLVWDNGGKTEARVVFADQPEKKFDFLLPVKPGSIKPDPFGNNLAVYK